MGRENETYSQYKNSNITLSCIPVTREFSGSGPSATFVFIHSFTGGKDLICIELVFFSLITSTGFFYFHFTARQIGVHIPLGMMLIIFAFSSQAVNGFH